MNILIKSILLIGLMTKAVIGLSAEENNVLVVPTGMVACFFEDTVIDGKGGSLALAGGGAIQLVVMPDVQVTFKNIALYNFSLQALYLLPGARVVFAEGISLYFDDAGDASQNGIIDVSDDVNVIEEVNETLLDEASYADEYNDENEDVLGLMVQRHPSGMTTALHRSRQKVRELFAQVVKKEKENTVVLGPLPKAVERTSHKLGSRKRNRQNRARHQQAESQSEHEEQEIALES